MAKATTYLASETIFTFTDSPRGWVKIESLHGSKDSVSIPFDDLYGFFGSLKKTAHIDESRDAKDVEYQEARDLTSTLLDASELRAKERKP